MKAEKDVGEANKDKQKTGVCPNTQHPTLTNKQRGNEFTVRPATLDGKQYHVWKNKNKIFGSLLFAAENDWTPFSALSIHQLAAQGDVSKVAAHVSKGNVIGAKKQNKTKIKQTNKTTTHGAPFWK